jgi:hypothetical protein
MRRLFGTDETYYAFIFILVLIVNGGFVLFGFESRTYLQLTSFS